MRVATGKTRKVRPSATTYKSLLMPTMEVLQSQGPRTLRSSTYKKREEAEALRELEARLLEEKRARRAEQAKMRQEIADLGNLMESMMKKNNNTNMSHTKNY